MSPTPDTLSLADSVTSAVKSVVDDVRVITGPVVSAAAAPVRIAVGELVASSEPLPSLS